MLFESCQYLLHFNLIIVSIYYLITHLFIKAGWDWGLGLVPMEITVIYNWELMLISSIEIANEKKVRIFVAILNFTLNLEMYLIIILIICAIKKH